MDERGHLPELSWTALCALLSLGAFVPLVAYAGRPTAALAVGISLACPLLWFLFLRWSRGGGDSLVPRASNLASHLYPTRRLKDRSAGIPVEGLEHKPCGATSY